jgi:hypothetical protein
MLVWILTVITAGATVDYAVYATQSECAAHTAIMQPAQGDELTCRASVLQTGVEMDPRA